MQKFYPVQYFIKKFEELPEEYFSLTTEKNPQDAWEWLDGEDEEDALYKIVRPYGLFIHVNDGVDEYAYMGDTVKKRILHFLNYIIKARSCALE